jgi:hypothetical protein
VTAHSVVVSTFKWIRDFLIRTRHIRRMNRLYRNGSLPIDPREKVILFWIPGGMPLMLHLEGAIAAALKLRGKKVHAVICDGVFSACVRREITDGIPIDEWSKSCKECTRTCSNTLSELGIEHSYIGDYVVNWELTNLKQAASNTTWNSVASVENSNVTIGKNIKSSILRYLKGHDLPVEPRLVHEYAYSGLVCAVAARNALTKFGCSRVFMSHGMYVDWGPALHTALAMQIPVTAWMASYLPSRFYFRHVSNGVHIDFHNITDSAWKEISTKELTIKQVRRLDEYHADRYLRNTSFDIQNFKLYVGTSTETLTKYKLDGTKPIWAIMAHINWDAVSDFAPMLFDSFNEWMSETLEIIKDVADVQWLVKVHPAEAWDNPHTGVEQLIRTRFPVLPEHVRVLSANENINPLDILELVDGAVTVFGTIGLELAMRGKPVILAGDAHYGKKGFTLDAESRDVYKGLLNQAAKISKINIDQIALAKKYAYCYFILRQIPVSVVTNPNSKWWAFQFDQNARLLPGKDPTIDFLCECLLNGKDFIMSPELEFDVKNDIDTRK